jgi:hypothetical protein
MRCQETDEIISRKGDGVQRGHNRIAWFWVGGGRAPTDHRGGGGLMPQGRGYHFATIAAWTPFRAWENIPPYLEYDTGGPRIL